MRRRFLSFAVLAFFSFEFSFAKDNENLVIEVSLDQSSFSSLDSDAKNFTNAAYSQFIKDLTMVSQISVHTAETDNELRKIQKRSQIEAATGLGSEEAAYATDKGSRAKLALSLKISPVGTNYQFSCMISDIETRDTFTSTTKKLPIAEVASDTVVDLLAYDVLSLLQKRKYISELSLDVTNQLKHQEDTIENFQKYVDDYAKQREEAERELAALRSASLSAEDRIAAENQERALQLKIEMAEKNRQIAEENLRRQQDEMLVRAQRQKDLESFSKGQRDKFQKDIEAIEKARAQIRKEGLSNLSLKKRIELIESAKVNLSRLEQQLKDSIEENKKYFDEQMDEEIARKNAEEWRKADLAGGVPTEAAKNIRRRQINEIQNKYTALKASVENDLRTSAQPGLNSYREQISSNIADMEKTTYVFRSIDVTDDFLYLKVNEYDGNLSAWEVESAFDLSSIPKVDTSAVILPNFTLSYLTMTGKSIPKENEKNYEKKYQEYQDTVDMADLYFRTSVPYIYSQLAIDVSYNEKFDSYVVTPVYFSLYRTQDNKTPLVRHTQSDFEKAEKIRAQQAKAERKRLREEADQARREEQERSEAEQRRFMEELRAEEQHQKELENEANRKRRLAGYHSKRGLYFDFGTFDGPFYSGNDFCFNYLVGGKNFYAGFDIDIATTKINDDYKEGAFFEEIPFVAANFILGYSFQFGYIFRPYFAAGIGGYTTALKIADSSYYSSLYSSDDEFSEPSGLSVLGMAGMDLVFRKFVLGAGYKLRYFEGSGFIDNYVFTIGFSL